MDELSRLLSLGQDHACCIDVRPVPEAPAYVRTVTLLEGGDLLIEFEQWGFDEGGLYYRVTFGSLAELVECVEVFLDKPLAAWRSLASADYPSRPSTTDDSRRQWRDLLVAGGPSVPPGGTFRGSSTWLSLLPGI